MYNKPVFVVSFLWFAYSQVFVLVTPLLFKVNFIKNLCYSDLLKIIFSSLTASRTAYSFLSGHPVVACLYWHTQSYVAMVVMTFTYRSMGTDTGCATSALYWVSDVVINDFISMARGCNEQSQYRVKCYRKNM